MQCKVLQQNMPRRNHRYHQDCYQDYHYQPCCIDWIILSLILGIIASFIIGFFIFFSNNEAELAKAEATKNYKKILSVAAQNCNSEVMKLFLERNLVKVHENRDFWESLLESVAEKGCLEIIQFLIEKKVDINATRALLYAAEQGNLEIVKFLLQKGANPNIRSYGQTSRDVAVTMSRRNENSNKPYREIIDLLTEAEKNYKLEK